MGFRKKLHFYLQKTGTSLDKMKVDKIRVLKGVASVLADNKKLLKSVGIFYALKSIYTTGVIIDYQSKADVLAEACFCCPRTFYTRVNELKALGLITVSDNRMNLASYDTLHKILDITVDKQRYRYLKVPAKPEYILRTTAIKENFERQEAAIQGKIEKYNKGSGLSIAEKMQKKEADLQRLIVEFKNSALLHRDTQDILYHPDVAISQNTLASIYGLKSQGSGLYWQKVLQKHKLIQVENRLIESSNRCRNSRLGIVFYSRKTQKTYCQMPNGILCL